MIPEMPLQAPPPPLPPPHPRNFNSLYDSPAEPDTLTGSYTTRTLTTGEEGEDDVITSSGSEPDLSAVFASRMLTRPASTGRSKLILADLEEEEEEDQRLPTQDRIHRWGILTTDSCATCSNGMEDLTYLFFECAFSSFIRNAVMEWMKFQFQVCSWNLVISWHPACLRGSSYMKKVKKIALAAAVYCLWRERNMRLYMGTRRTKEEVLKQIKVYILTILYHRPIPPTHCN